VRKVSYYVKGVGDSNLCRECTCFGAEFEVQAVLEAVEGLKILNELSSQYSVRPNQSSARKHEVLEEGATVFFINSARRLREREALEAELYEQIGRPPRCTCLNNSHPCRQLSSGRCVSASV